MSKPYPLCDFEECICETWEKLAVLREKYDRLVMVERVQHDTISNLTAQNLRLEIQLRRIHQETRQKMLKILDAFQFRLATECANDNAKGPSGA